MSTLEHEGMSRGIGELLSFLEVVAWRLNTFGVEQTGRALLLEGEEETSTGLKGGRTEQGPRNTGLSRPPMVSLILSSLPAYGLEFVTSVSTLVSRVLLSDICTDETFAKISRLRKKKKKKFIFILNLMT